MHGKIHMFNYNGQLDSSMDNVGKETQGGSLRGFVIARIDNYLQEATPSKLES